MTLIQRFFAGAIVFAVMATNSVAVELQKGMLLSDALEQFRAEGLNIVYSSDLVRPDMRVDVVPPAGEPRARLNGLLAQFDFKIKDGPNETLLLVRAVVPAPDEAPDPPRPAAQLPDPAVRPALDEIVVSTSRYEFSRDGVVSATGFSAADLEILPNVGDDPLRALERLPGAATNDFSARVNVRGGYSDENLIRLDGFRLYNPFHFKDFQGLFSVIDPRLVGGMDVYTGGFNAGRGDVMSSVIDVKTVDPDQDQYREVSASFFNLSGLYASRFNRDKTSWLVSARRGNLDWVIDTLDPKLGKPKYFDVYTRLSHRFSDSLILTGSILLIDDDIDIADTDEEEFAQDNYRDSYYWLRMDLIPSDVLNGNILLSRSDLDGLRSGSVEKEGATLGEQFSSNDFTIDSLETNWTLALHPDWLLQFGGEYRHQSGSYRYMDDAEFELVFLTPGAPLNGTRSNDRSSAYSGDYYSVYGNIRTQWTKRITSEFGLRWSKETLSAANDSAIDPRFGIKFELSPATHLRLNAGRFSQSQTVDQLFYADGELEFRPMEHVDQVVASLDHDLTTRLSGRAEIYYKKYSDLRPRYENFLDTFTLLPQLWPDRIELLADQARAKGLELTLRSQTADPLNWWVSYSWSKVEDQWVTGNNLRSWDQRNAVGAGLDWSTDKWEFSVAGRIQDGRPTTATELDALSDPATISTGVRNAEQLGTYFTLDARMARHWQLDNSEFTMFVEVRNITNRDNECCVLYELNDEDGPVEYETDVEFQIPVFPSLGFIWQF